MSNIIDKYIKGESINAYEYFGAHRVNDGFCFRLYSPHAKEVDLVLDKSYKMEKIDFRGVFEIRVKDVKEFQSYRYEILTKDNVWIDKNDPYSFFSESNHSVTIDSDDYKFNDEKWLNRNADNYFNACLINDDLKIDEQRDFISYLKENHFNYLIVTPYQKRNLFCVNRRFINDSSFKTFINNLHQVNIGIIFEFNLTSFYDYSEGLDEFDGESIYNLKENKYEDVSQIYFDLDKGDCQSYLKSLVNYYLDKFHGDGVYLDDNNFTRSLNLDNKLVIYKGKENSSQFASDSYLNKIIDNFNEQFDHKKYIQNNEINNSYLVYDYNKCIERIKGNEETKKSMARMLLAITYISNFKRICVYSDDEEFNKGLSYVSSVVESKALLNKGELFLNGKKNNYFGYEFSSRNDYLMIISNFGELNDPNFDIAMAYYGYYKLVYDSKNNCSSDELFVTRRKKIQNRELAMKVKIEPMQVLVYRRIRDI